MMIWVDESHTHHLDFLPSGDRRSHGTGLAHHMHQTIRLHPPIFDLHKTRYHPIISSTCVCVCATRCCYIEDVASTWFIAVAKADRVQSGNYENRFKWYSNVGVPIWCCSSWNQKTKNWLARVKDVAEMDQCVLIYLVLAFDLILSRSSCWHANGTTPRSS